MKKKGLNAPNYFVIAVTLNLFPLSNNLIRQDFYWFYIAV